MKKLGVVSRVGLKRADVEDKDRAQVTLESIGDAVISTDSAGKITFLNLMAERLTAWPVRKARGRPIGEVFNVVDATTRESIANPLEPTRQQHRPGTLPGCCATPTT